MTLNTSQPQSCNSLFPYLICPRLSFSAALFFWEVGVGEKKGLEGSFGFVVVCCFVCQRCFVWALMPVSSKALLLQDMQLEIDRWVDRERQTAGDTGTDCREAKGTLYIMPVPSKILFYLQKLFRNGEKRPFPPLTSLQRRCFINHYHGPAWIIFYTCEEQRYLSFSDQRK